MPDHNALPSVDRIAVIDIGSNSLRLVVFERLGATLLPLLNEKVMCGLGRNIARTEVEPVDNDDQNAEEDGGTMKPTQRLALEHFTNINFTLSPHFNLPGSTIDR